MMRDIRAQRLVINLVVVNHYYRIRNYTSVHPVAIRIIEADYGGRQLHRPLYIQYSRLAPQTLVLLKNEHDHLGGFVGW